MSSPNPQILLTGATGYVGGTVLASLLSSSSPALKNSIIHILLRGSASADKLVTTYGTRVHPILYKDLDDLDATAAAASKADFVINAGPGFHLPSAEALLRGLAQRKKDTGKEVWFVQTSGTSNVADRPFTKLYVEDNPEREFDDAKDDVYSYETDREKLHAYTQRTTELGVVKLGIELGVKTLVIMSPLIYGKGAGLGNQGSIQIPTYVRAALDYGSAVVVGKGEGVWDHVHVQDLGELYLLVTEQILAGEERIPHGKKGIIFSANGRHSWASVAEKVADILVQEGKLKNREVKSLSLEEGTKTMTILGMSSEEMVELGLSSNSRTVSTVARSLGWEPTRGEKAWDEAFTEDVKAVLEERK